jgi:hypothetical protein
MDERRFEKWPPKSGSEQMPRLGDSSVDVSRISVDQNAVGNLKAGELANPVTGFEEQPSSGIYDSEISTMDLQPQPLWAVLEGCKLRFGKARRHGHFDAGRRTSQQF